jgi:mono/diheme cytochrome c family protein
MHKRLVQTLKWSWLPGLAVMLSAGNAIAQEAPAAEQGAAAADQEASAVEQGARTYGAMCGRCHNPRSPLERSDRDWVVIINHMRVRANLTGKESRNVLAFLQATNTDPSVPAGAGAEGPSLRHGPPSDDPEAIAQGRQMVTAKACVGCHVVGETGGSLGPSLNGVVEGRGADYVRKKLANPVFDNAASMMPNFGLTEEQIEAMLAYLATLE